jgi:hypothetical protein
MLVKRFYQSEQDILENPDLEFDFMGSLPISIDEETQEQISKGELRFDDPRDHCVNFLKDGRGY